MKRITHTLISILAMAVVCATCRSNAAEATDKCEAPSTTPHQLGLLKGDITPYVAKCCPQSDLVGGVRLHITTKLLAGLSSGKYRCKGCVTRGNLNVGAPNDDIGKSAGVLSPPDQVKPEHNRTPLDIDLSHFGTNMPKGNRAVLIKILLDDPRLNFITLKSQPDQLDSSYALVKSWDSDLVFKCRSDLAKAPQGSTARKKKYVVLRVVLPEKGKGRLDGGLNIGVSMPAYPIQIGKMPKPEPALIPFYIDPIITHNG